MVNKKLEAQKHRLKAATEFLHRRREFLPEGKLNIGYLLAGWDSFTDSIKTVRGANFDLNDIFVAILKEIARLRETRQEEELSDILVIHKLLGSYLLAEKE